VPNLPQPSCTVPPWLACTARARPSLARLRLGLRSVRGPRPSPTRPGAACVLCGGDVTGAREATQGRARWGLTGAWTAVRLSSRCRRRRADGMARRLPRRRRRRRRRKGMRAAAGGAMKVAAQWLTDGDGDSSVRTVDERWLHRRTGGSGEASTAWSASDNGSRRRAR
jgi:hypothetical protein